MDIRNYLETLGQRKWLIAVTLAVTVVVAVAGTLWMTPTYQASATLRVGVAAAGSASTADYMYADRLINTYAKIAASGPVLEELGKRLGQAEPPRISVAVVPSTELFKVTVEESNPILARDAANALADILVAQSKQLYTGGAKSGSEILGEQLTQLQQELDQAQANYETLVAQASADPEKVQALRSSIELKQGVYGTLLQQYEKAQITEALQASALTIIEPASIPQAPSKPNKVRNIAVGIVLGLMGGLSLAFLFEHLDTTLRGVQRIEEVTSLPALGSIPSDKGLSRRISVTVHSPQREAFRRLRTNLCTLIREQDIKTLLVTSAGPGEGKTTVVANLALAVARSGRRVVAVDTDLRRPTLHTFFHMSNARGLGEVLAQTCRLEQALQFHKAARVWVLPSGNAVLETADLLAAGMPALLERLTMDFDIVLLDSPALLAVTDAAVVAPMADGVLLVVGASRTEEDAVRAACRQLADVKARVIGLVVNRVNKRGGSYYNYYVRMRKQAT
jgi:capsular exopolysaccharide synthesis family protein